MKGTAMKTFIAIVHKDTDSAYGIQFPDVPGCFSAADTLDALLPNAVEALALWFEDADPITPRDLSEIAAETADQIADGAMLVAVPLITNAARPVRVNVSLDRGVLDAIDTAARGRNLTRSAFLAEAARNEIEGRH